MNSREKGGQFGFFKKTAILIGVCLGLISGCIALFVCFSQLESKKVHVLDSYENGVSTWLNDTAQSVGIWNEDMRNLRLRVSGSETFRLYAGDVYGLDRNSSKSGAAENGELSGTAAAISEETPLIRGILLDFMNYNGLQDARLVNREGKTIVAAHNTPTPLTTEESKAALQTIKTGQTTFLPVRGSSNDLVLDVFEPVFDLENSKECVAVFMTSEPVLSKITQFIARPKQNDMATAVMLQKRGNVWERVQAPMPVPLPEVLQKALDKDRGDLSFALRDSVFGDNKPVYSMSILIPELNWSLVQEIPAADMDALIFRAELPVYITTLLGWLSFMLLCGLIWWMAMGRHQLAVTSELSRLNQVVSRQKELLDSVTMSIDAGLFMVDVKGQIRVCNPALAAILGKPESEIRDQSLISCFPLQVATSMLENVRKVALNKKEVNSEVSIDKNGEPRLYRVMFSPFMDAGASNMRDSIRGAVITMKDITEFRRQSERMRKRQQSLIEAFIKAEESVDPYLAGHSVRMARLGELVANDMDLSNDSKSTVIMGAQLSQVGKLFIPREILTNKGKLTAEELKEVRRAPEHAFNLMKGVDFNLPIARALHEMYENVNGSGYPQGLSGAEILPEARILAVINAFCAMVSSRSYHKGMDENSALAELEKSPHFDQSVVQHLKKVLNTPEGIMAVRNTQK